MTGEAATRPETTATAIPSTLTDVLTLAKLRLNTLVVFTTAGGYYMAAPNPLDLPTLGWTCLGTTLVAGGAAGLNQVIERDTDRLMTRTRLRPVADARLSPAAGTWISVAMALAGLLILMATSTVAAMAVALVTLIVYAAFYTPLKRRSSFATVVGAVPGALPPLIGWAAVRGDVSGMAPWSLFLIGFFWQLPHVLAVSWMYRDEYARAGIPVLPVLDPEGGITARQMVLWAAALVSVSVLPYLIGLTSAWYAIGALVLGFLQLYLAFVFLWRRSRVAARSLFFASITYLPALWILMVLSRL